MVITNFKFTPYDRLKQIEDDFLDAKNNNIESFYFDVLRSHIKDADKKRDTAMLHELRPLRNLVKSMANLTDVTYEDLKEKFAIQELRRRCVIKLYGEIMTECMASSSVARGGKTFVESLSRVDEFGEIRKKNFKIEIDETKLKDPIHEPAPF